MKCEECRQQIDALLSGRLDDRARSSAEAHLRECDACASSLEEARKLWQLLGQATMRSPSHGFSDRVLRQLDQDPEPMARWWAAWIRYPRWVFAAVSFLLILVAGSVLVARHLEAERNRQMVAHFEELFSVAQADDPETILMMPLVQHGDTL